MYRLVVCFERWLYVARKTKANYASPSNYTSPMQLKYSLSSQENRGEFNLLAALTI